MGRREPTLTAKLAAALRELLQIPYEHAKLMTDDQVLSLVQWHHIHYWEHHKDLPDVDAHWNLDPMPIRAHRDRTAKIDIPQIGKTRRLSKAEEDFQKRLLTPRADRPAKKSKWGSRPFPKRSKSK